MINLLKQHNIEIGYFDYSYNPTAIEWWENGEQTTVQINIGQYEVDQSIEVQVWFSNDDDDTLAFQSVFSDNSVKKTFVAESIARERYHSMELTFDDEQMAYSTSSLEDSKSILEDILSCISSEQLSSKEEGDRDKFLKPVAGEALSKLIENLNMNDIHQDPEELLEITKGTVEFDGFGYLIELLNDLNANQSEPSSRNEAIKTVCKQYLKNIIKDLQIELEGEDEELSDVETSLLFGLLCDEPSNEIVVTNGIDENDVEEKTVQALNKISVDNKQELVDFIEESEHIHLFNIIE